MTERQTMLERFHGVRTLTERLAEPLTVEDQVVQTMPDVSPTKWHRAHTTWFFETFVLKSEVESYQPFNEDFEYLFNSYYNSVGPQFIRSQRGLLSRPGVREAGEYRAHVDAAMTRLLEPGVSNELAQVIEIGLQHEQQHQELLLTDIKHVLGFNPLHPVYREDLNLNGSPTTRDTGWLSHDNGVYRIGRDADDGAFCWDNETPRHEVLVRGFQLADRLVTNGEYLEFVQDGGYREPSLWLSEGFATVQEQGWEAPLYWVRKDDQWFEFTLAGLRPLNLNAPVCHVSYFEADAYATWADARLPTEAEWELVAIRDGDPEKGAFVDDDCLHPLAATAEDNQLFGHVWEWTASPYVAYPGYEPLPGALGEYNGKFMCNQWVLRGGSVGSSRDHIRSTYRNFFYAHQRWQFTGIRLAR